MAATVIIQDASFECGARLGGLIAQSLEEFERVRVILRDDGPLQVWLSEHVHGSVDICSRANFPYEAPFAERVLAASSLLEGDSSDIVYIFGLGATDFALAARSQDRRVVLHAYQTAQQIEHCLARDQTKRDCASFCDALLVTENYSQRSMSRLFGRTPARVQNIGPRVDFEWLNGLSQEQPAALRNAAGEQLEWTRRFVVGGRSVAEGDVSFFVSLARACPDIDFAWFGPDPHPENGNAINGRAWEPSLPNLYAGVGSHNLWQSLPALRAYVICGHERDAIVPLVASALGIPVVGFSTGGAAEFLGHHGILCHGSPSLTTLSKILKKIAAEPAAPLDGAEGRRQQLDISGCANTIMQILAEVRLMESN